MVDKKDNLRLQRNLLLFIIIATMVTTTLDLLIVKSRNLSEYVILNFWEWFMFGVGFFAGRFRWKASS
jgi:hypothetical protein